jgi:glycosyltransferase involved in cell wall biosynthesis
MSTDDAVLLVGGYAGLKSHSMVLFADSLAGALRARGSTVRQLDPPVVLARVGGRRLRKWLAHVDRLLIFPLLLAVVARRHPLIHLCDHSFAFYAALLPGKRVVITCHDLIGLRRADGGYAEESASVTGRVLQAAVRAQLRTAPHLVCVSDATRADLQALLDIDDACVKVVHNGLNRPYAPMSAADIDAALQPAPNARHDLRALTHLPYLLHVGSGAWRKNRAGVVEIFAEVRARAPHRAESLLMVGDAPDAELRARIDRLGVASRVHFVSGVAHPALRALYCRAQWLLFPSFYEGFGWPVIEAQACGCPVLTSDRAPLPEVAGDAAVFVDPDVTADAAARLLAAWPARARLVAAGLDNARRFSMARMADGYAAVYAEAVAVAPGAALSSHPDFTP